MRVLVFEQWRGGHYFNYLEALIPRLAELADEVVVAMTKSAMTNDDFQERFGAIAAMPGVRFEASVPAANPALPARESVNLLRNLRAAVSRARPDYLMVPSADAQTLAMGILGYLGVSMLPRGLPAEATLHYGYGPAINRPGQHLKDFVYRCAFSGSTWTDLNFVNFFYYQHGVRERYSWVDRARLIADPVPTVPRLGKIAARRMLSIPEDGRYLGLLGELDARKAIPELLAAFRAASLAPSDRMLLAGRLDADYRRLIHRDHADLLSAGRLVLIDRYLTKDELLQGFGALDVVCPVYRDFPGLASLMLKGIAAGRPMLAQNFGWCEAMIRKFAIGHTADIRRVEGFAETMRLALEASAGYRETDAVRRLLSFHEPANFAAGMTERLRCALGRPAAHPIKTWDWVVEGLSS